MKAKMDGGGGIVRNLSMPECRFYKSNARSALLKRMPSFLLY